MTETNELNLIHFATYFLFEINRDNDRVTTVNILETIFNKTLPGKEQ